MGLEQLLSTNGSNLSRIQDGPLPTLDGSTADSKLHADRLGEPGFSLNGNDQATVNQQQQQYSLGVPPIGINPSRLDLDGVNPNAALIPGNSSAYAGPINNTFDSGTYRNGLPAALQGRV